MATSTALTEILVIGALVLKAVVRAVCSGLVTKNSYDGVAPLVQVPVPVNPTVFPILFGLAIDDEMSAALQVGATMSTVTVFDVNDPPPLVQGAISNVTTYFPVARPVVLQIVVELGEMADENVVHPVIVVVDPAGLVTVYS